ncbi:MAG: DUF6252 family protein [Flavobacteriaceae bacterium]
MKNLFLLLFVALIAFSSCENVEKNGAVIQANVDSLFFKSFDAVGAQLEDGSITMQGLTDNQIITLHINQTELGTYRVGGDRGNYATFEDSNGRVYLTNPYGEGEINLTDRCISCGLLTGNFRFTAILPGIDTLYVDKGIFFDVPFGVGEDIDNPNAGSFSAAVDGAPFNPVTVGAVASGNSLLISGVTLSSTIIIRLPLDVSVGNYSLPQAGYQATYSVGASSQNAILGNISVITHNTAARTLSGSFSFVTSENNTITEGQFNVTY